MLYQFRYEVVWNDSSMSHYYFEFFSPFHCFNHLKEMMDKLRSANSITVLEIQEDSDDAHYVLFATAMKINGHILYFNSLPK